MERYELWIRQGGGAERKFTVNTRLMPARTGHLVSLITTVGERSELIGIVNHSAINGENYAQSDAPPLLRVPDFLLLTVVLIALVVKLSSAGVALFVPVAAAYLLIAGTIRAVKPAWLIGRVHRAIDLEARAVSAARKKGRARTSDDHQKV